MRRFILLFLGLGFTSSIFADKIQPQEASLGKAQFCKKATQKNYQRGLLLYPLNMLSFRNQSGRFGTGQCWWHSELTRKFTYLAYYSPEKARPSQERVKEILDNIMVREQVTEIPGYSNLGQFSSQFEKLFVDYLDSALIDSTLSFGFLRGALGAATDDYKTQEVLIKRTKDMVEQGDVVYHNLQFPGLVNHAWLVLDVEELLDGYVMEVIDSNEEFGSLKVLFQKDKGFSKYMGRSVSPYIMKKDELANMKKEISNFCQ